MQRCVLVLAATLGPMWAFGAIAESPSWSPASTFAAYDGRDEVVKRRVGSGPAERAPVPPLPVRKTAKGAEPVPQTWSAQEIAAAQARCARLLKKVDAVYVPHPPIKERRCGDAAPIRLMSLGQPQVSFSPPALVNCQMAAALNTWITRHVQPLARKHLGERIAKVEVMSDYSCRNSTGRHRNRLSEHAFADALDIRGFVTESGKTAHVLDTWGITRRDIEAHINALKAQAMKEAALRAAADRTAQENLQDGKAQSARPAPAPTALASTLGTAGAGLARRTRADGIEKIKVTLPGAPTRTPAEIAARLGGPNSPKDHQQQETKLATLGPQLLADPIPGPRSQFLRAAHAAACRIFGTTLGPEANEAHRNHFHVDMAERKYKKICD